MRAREFYGRREAGGWEGGEASGFLQAEGKLAGATALKGALAPAFSRPHVTAAAGQVTLAATLTPANLIPFVMNFAPSLNIRSPALATTFGVSACCWCDSSQNRSGFTSGRDVYRRLTLHALLRIHTNVHAIV